MTDKERETYCNDCDRSINGRYHDCDVNIENNGKYVMAGDKVGFAKSFIENLKDAAEFAGVKI